MADVIPHFCTGEGCAALHGGSRESDEVKVAKINAERDVEVAKLSRASDRDWNDTMIEETKIEAETDIAVTEIAAEAAVEESVVAAEVLDEIVNPEPEPVQVEMTEPEPEPEAVGAPPEVETGNEEVKSSGWWDSYR